MIVQVNVVIEEFDMNMNLNKIKIDSLRESPASFSGLRRSKFPDPPFREFWGYKGDMFSPRKNRDFILSS
jgi:hypothetical protein